MLLERHTEVTGLLKEHYEDKDGLRKQEIAALSGPNEFGEFYSRFKVIKEFHEKHPDEISVPMSVEFEELNKMREKPNEEMANLVDFTDEEGYGRFLDLHECYTRYINLRGVEKMDYVTYSTRFDQLYNIPRERKNQEYRAYLGGLLDYLYGYLQRVKPLMDVEAELAAANEDFDKQWTGGTFNGWTKDTPGTGALAHSGAHLDLSAFSTWEELASLGLDRLKSALMALGLKCGGTLEERAQRLFSTKGKELSQLDQGLFAPAKKKEGRGGTSEQKQKEMALLEAHIYRIADLLAEQKAATKENIERRQARTPGEEEDEEQEEAAESDHSEPEMDDDIPYNPKNLPLGWDGKPIPYWLYKLHGLNISYNCEICGNYTYKGPKAFQRHFAEWRHAHGMRCLGIPNTAHFANVTSIEDAIARE